MPRNFNDLSEAVNAIQRFTETLENNYTNLEGWAPDSSVEWLTENRLIKMNSLAKNLNFTLNIELINSNLIEGRLILAWSHLGSLAEMSLQVMLGIFYEDFEEESYRPTYRGRELDLDEINFFKLLKFLETTNFWNDNEKDYWINWLHNLRKYRNTIHAFEDKDLGTWDKVQEYTMILGTLLQNFHHRLPPIPSDYQF